MNRNCTDISIVIPLYNSGERILPLYQSLAGILRLYSNYEIIFVDDGSKDNTIAIIKGIEQRDSHVHIVQLEKNMGQYEAIFAGYKCSKGKIVVSLDDDAFEEVIYTPEFIKKIEDGYDVVFGWRKKEGYPFLRKAASFVFNIFISLIIGKRIHDIGSSLKARNRRVVDDLISMGELTCFLRYKYYRTLEIRIPHKYSKKFPSRYKVTKLIKSALLISKSNIFNSRKYRQSSIENYVENQL